MGLETIMAVIFAAGPAMVESGALPDPLAAGWKGEPTCEVLRETLAIRVLRCTFVPGSGHERHFHAPHFGYALGGGDVQIRDAGGTRRVTLGSDSYFASDGVAWHEIENVGDSTVRYLIVEPKHERPASTESFGWLSGHWCARTNDLTVEEMWMPSVAGETLGVGRTYRDARMVSFEHLRVGSVDGVPTLFATPQGQTHTAFSQTASGTDWARFENPLHDFPKVIEYRRTDRGLTATVAGGDRRLTFDYAPCRAR